MSIKEGVQMSVRSVIAVCWTIHIYDFQISCISESSSNQLGRIGKYEEFELIQISFQILFRLGQAEH